MEVLKKIQEALQKADSDDSPRSAVFEVMGVIFSTEKPAELAAIHQGFSTLEKGIPSPAKEPRELLKEMIKACKMQGKILGEETNKQFSDLIS